MLNTFCISLQRISDENIAAAAECQNRGIMFLIFKLLYEKKSPAADEALITPSGSNTILNWVSSHRKFVNFVKSLKYEYWKITSPTNKSRNV